MKMNIKMLNVKNKIDHCHAEEVGLSYMEKLLIEWCIKISSIVRKDLTEG